MSKSKALAAAPDSQKDAAPVSTTAKNSVPASPASQAPQPYAGTGAAALSMSTSGAATPDTAPKLGLPSTDDENVVRARRRSDVIPLEVQQAAYAETMRYLASMSRSPFRKVLAELIEAKPTPEAVRRFADKYPDRWAQAVSMMAGLSGFDRGVIELNVFNIKGLSDIELMRRLDHIDAEVTRLRGPRLTGEMVDAEVVGSPDATNVAPEATIVAQSTLEPAPPGTPG